MRRLSLFLVCCGLAVLGPVSAQAQAGSVAGTVTPVGSAQEVEVCVVETQPSELCTAPQADGSYVLQGVPLGPVRIEFVPGFRSRLIKQYYNHKQVLSEANAVVLSSVTPDVKGIDADLVEGGSIEGTVTAAVGGEPLAEVEVCAVSVGMPTVKSCGETDPGGEYELHSLPGASYKVGFWGRGASAEYQPWFYLGKASAGEATPVPVTVGDATAGIDAALAMGGRIEGSVTAVVGGAVLEGISVCLFVAAAPKPERCTYSGVGGNYEFAGLPSGSYQVGFSLEPGEVGGEAAAGEVDGFLTQYFANAETRATAQTIPLLSAQVANGVDASLLTPAPPAPPAPAPAVASPIVAAAPPIAEPKPKPKRCKKGYRKRKVKGRVRCVKAGKHRRHGKRR